MAETPRKSPAHVLFAATLLSVVLVVVWLWPGDAGVAPSVVSVPEQGASGPTTLLPEEPGERQRVERSPDVSELSATAGPEAERLPGAVDVQVFGRVVDLLGAPVEGALVRFLPNVPTLSRPDREVVSLEDRQLPELDWPSVRTGADGRFEFSSQLVPSLPSDVLTPEDDRWPRLIVSHEAFATRVHRCAPLVGGTHDAGDIEVGPGALLVADVLDKSGRPVPHPRLGVGSHRCAAQVAPDRPREHPMCVGFLGTEGDARGHVEWRLGLSGRVDVLVEAPGFVRAMLPRTELEPGQRIELGEVVLHRGGTVAGRVVDLQGHGVSDAQVLATTRLPDDGSDRAAELLRQPGRHTEARTGADGAFLIGGLAAGEVHVVVGAPGMEPLLLPFVTTQDTDLGTLELEPAATLLLHLRSSDGRPLTEADVRGERATSPAAPEAPGWPLLVTSQDTTWLLSGLGPLGNELRVAAPGHVAQTVSMPGVEPGAALERDVVLERAAGLAGVLMAVSDGAPVAGARVQVRSADGSPAPVASLRSGPDGTFAFDGLAAGHWELVVQSEKHLEQTLDLELAAAERRGDLELWLSSGASVVGRVLGTDGSGVSGQVVTAVSWDVAGVVQVLRRTRSLADGTFQLHGLPPGKVVVEAPLFTPRPVDLVGGETVEVLLQQLVHRYLSGRVHSEGQVVEGALVTLEALEQTDAGLERVRLGTMVTDDRGEFELSVFIPGEYGVRAQHPTGGQTAEERVSMDMTGDVVVDLAFAAGALDGLVVGPAGQPVAGAAVELLSADGRRRVFAATSDEHGTFRASHLEPATYRLGCRAEGWPRVDGQLVEVRDDAPASVTCRLRPGAHLSGRLMTQRATALAATAHIVLVAADGSTSVVAVLDETEYACPAVLPGDYLLQVWRSPWEAATGDRAGLLWEAPLTLGEGVRSGYDVTVP